MSEKHTTTLLVTIHNLPLVFSLSVMSTSAMGIMSDIYSESYHGWESATTSRLHRLFVYNSEAGYVTAAYAALGCCCPAEYEPDMR